MVRDYIKREAERRHPLAVSQYDYPTEQRAVRDFCEGAGWATEETMRKAAIIRENTRRRKKGLPKLTQKEKEQWYRLMNI